MPDNPEPIAHPDLPPAPSKTLPLPTRPAEEWYPQIITEQELKDAVAVDAYYNTLLATIEQDKKYLLELHQYKRYELQPLLTKTRNAILRAHRRVAARQRQLKYVTKLLKKRLAYEKIKEARRVLKINT